MFNPAIHNRFKCRAHHPNKVNFGAQVGFFSTTHRKLLSVRCVPFAASQAANLSVSYVETRRLVLNDQRLRSAQ